MGERRIQTSMGGNAKYAHRNPWSGVCPSYGAHCYRREKVIFPVASHHGVLQQQEEAQISRDLAHPGKWARETERGGEANTEVTFCCMGHGIVLPVSTAGTVILTS